jgi:hypothetical protein
MELNNAVIQNNTDLNNSATDSIALARCLDAGKSFMELLLEHPVQVYNMIPFVVWARLPLTIVSLSNLTLHSEMINNDRRPRLELYLEALCNRMQMMTTYRPPHQPCPDFWKAMFLIKDQARTWYVKSLKSSVQMGVTSVRSNNTSCPVERTETVPTEGPLCMPSSEQYDAHSFGDFLTLDWWGGFEGYDPTIISSDDLLL